MKVKSNIAYLLIGGNLGNKEENLRIAKKHIGNSAGKIINESSVYETASWGFEHEESFLNQALLIGTESSPLELLEKLLDIETSMGRFRTLKGINNSAGYSGRTMDIDILFFNDEIINEKNLTIPHPRIQERSFTLIPLNEIAKDHVHPVLHKKVSILLNECSDRLMVRRL